jgi:hypothetical protein
MKTGSDALGTVENEYGHAKLKTGPNALGTVKKESGQNMKMGAYALGTVENVSGSAKHENGTRNLWYRRKGVRHPPPSVPPKTSLGAPNLKMGPDALGTAGNDAGSAKHENGT